MERVALVIGNSAYSEKPLDNPCNDAVDIAKALRKYGFVVHECLDATFMQMEMALDKFRADLYSANVGLFFFAGHGVQVDDVNYLLAVDSKLTDEVKVKHSSLKLNQVIEYMEKHNPYTSLIILDACRDNPWEKKWHRSVASSGLAPVYAPKGTLIAFATSPGQKACDGPGRRNGAYTAALLQHIGQPDCTIEAMFKRVRNTLSAATDGKQISWEHTSLAGEFHFNLSVAKRIDDYKMTSLKDELLTLDSSRISHGIIQDLKSHTWDTQNKTLDSFDVSVASRIGIDNLFVIGRNIYQSACGESRSAANFIRTFATRTKGLDENKRKALLDGMLFEVFFDGQARLRKVFKDQMFDLVFSLQKYEYSQPSFEFISECLLSHASSFYSLPGKNIVTAVDIVLESKPKSKSPLVEKICIASQNVLRAEDDDDREPWYRTYKREVLESEISTQLLIPKHLLTFNYVGVSVAPNSMQFSDECTVRKAIE